MFRFCIIFLLSFAGGCAKATTVTTNELDNYYEIASNLSSCSVKLRVWKKGTASYGNVNWNQKGLNCSQSQLDDILNKTSSLKLEINSFLIQSFQKKEDRAELVRSYLSNTLIMNSKEDTLKLVVLNLNQKLIDSISSRFGFTNTTVSDVRWIEIGKAKRVLPKDFVDKIDETKQELLPYTLSIKVD